MNLLGSQLVLAVSLIGICVGLVILIRGLMKHQRSGLYSGIGLSAVGIVALFMAMGSFNASAEQPAPDRYEQPTD